MAGHESTRKGTVTALEARELISQDLTKGDDRAENPFYSDSSSSIEEESDDVSTTVFDILSTSSDVPSTSSGRRSRGRGKARGRGTLRQRSSSLSRDEYKWDNVTGNDIDCPGSFCFTPTDQPGPRNIPPTAKRPIDFFKLFFTESLVGKVVEESNRFGAVKAATAQTQHSRLSKWKETTLSEMYLLIGMLLNMGIIRLPSLKSYWKTDLASSVPFFPTYMSRDRFCLMFESMLHCCETDEQYRFKGDKIQPLMDILVDQFQKYFVPFEEISADESMIGFKGRVAWRQYNPNKPIKWGLLARTLADASTGYLLNINMYYGKTKGQQLPEGITKTSDSIIQILQPYLDRGYHVFCDRLYTSLPLAQYLHERRTYLTGTLNRMRKGLPPLVKSKMHPGEVIALRSRNLLVVNWCDKRVVTMLTTRYRGDEMVTVHVRGRPQGVEKPLVIDMYNRYMGGVDLCDQYTAYYNFSRRSVEWWKKVFFWMIEISVTNSYLLYKITRSEEERKGLSLLKFRGDLVWQLVESSHTDIPRTSRGRPSLPSTSQSPLAVTRFTKMFHRQERIQGRARECRFCSMRQGKRRDTTFMCTTCDDHPALHPGPCFSDYHTKGSQAK